MLKVNMRGGFSDRNNIKPLNTEIQMTEFDDHTRVQMINTISKIYDYFYFDNVYCYDIVQKFIYYFVGEVFSASIDDYSMDKLTLFQEIKNVIMTGSYDDVLTIIEALVSYWADEIIEEGRARSANKLYKKLNDLFEREYVGYRFIDGKICPISDQIEISAIETAIQNPYAAVTDHLRKAEIKLSDRNNPDYENSIKESITAVEAMCEVFLGEKATLGELLNEFEKRKIPIHKALKDAFSKLYGYTSDANGIRHAGTIGGSSSTFEEAKFMLVSCCAFINYLKGLQSKI